MARIRRSNIDKEYLAGLQAMVGDERIDSALAYLDQKRIEKHSIHHFRHDPVVYYMRMDRLIKIGTTKNILMRHNSIQPQGVLAIEPGGVPVERLRHGQFWDQHSHGEWYWLNEALWELIVDRRDDWHKRTGETVDAWLARHEIAASRVELDQGR